MRVFRIFVLLLVVGDVCRCLAQQSPDAEADTRAPEDTARIHSLTRKGKSILYEYPDSALQYFQEAQRLAADGAFVAEVAENKGCAGVAHYIRGEYDLALPLFFEALALYRDQKDAAGLSTSYNRIGLIYLIQKRHEDAIAFHRKGVSHAKAVGRVDLQSSANFNIGLAYDETAEFDSALFYLQTALDQARSARSAQMILMSLNRMAKVYFHRQQYDTALMLYDSVLNHSEHESNWETCFAQAGLAETYDAVGHYDRAVAVGLESLSLARQMNARWDVVHVMEILARSYGHGGKFKEAYEMALMTQALKDSLLNEEKEDKLNYIQLKETALAKATLEKENALQSARLEQKNFQVLTAMIISVSLVCIILALYSRQRQKNKLNLQLKEVNDRIAQQNKDLSELNESKNQLLSIISHDMRGPVANLKGLLTLARQGYLGEQERVTLFEQLEHNFNATSTTLENLLEWSRTQIEGSVPNPETVAIDDVIDRVYAFWEPALRQKKITFHFDRSGHNACADPHQLDTVVRNVLGNAIKYTPHAGAITIYTLHRDDKVGIVIGDTGIGMPASIRESLFEFKKQNQRPGTSREKGSGVGLMISRQLLEKNGGWIEVDSQEGEGTTFTLWVPSA